MNRGSYGNLISEDINKIVVGREFLMKEDGSNFFLTAPVSSQFAQEDN